MNRSEVLTLLRERIVAFAASRIMRGGTAVLSPDDVAQDTLLLIEEKYAHVQAFEELVPLAMQIVRYKLLGVFAKSSRRGEFHSVPVEDVPLLDLLDSPEIALLKRERSARLQSALAELGDRCRELFSLKLAGLNFPAIAARMGAANINTVYTWDSRCRQQLIEKIGKNDSRRVQ